MDAVITPYIQRGLDNATREGVITEDTIYTLADLSAPLGQGAHDISTADVLETYPDHKDPQKAVDIYDGYDIRDADTFHDACREADPTCKGETE